jgi:hypothetical protein
MTRSTQPAGLCEGCRHAREIRSARGSRFVLCNLAATDPRLRRYPQLPVLECHGVEPSQGSGARDQGSGAVAFSRNAKRDL